LAEEVDMKTERKNTVVITGGGGVLCAEIAVALARSGSRIVLVDINRERLNSVSERIGEEGGDAYGFEASVLSKHELGKAMEEIAVKFGGVDVLINGAGGNRADATTSVDRSFFDLPEEALRFVFDLNLMGTFLASQAFGRGMAEQGHGVILNIASMNAVRPLTRIPAYSAAKAAVANFTQWLAVYMAQEYSPRVRVIAIAPGFFLTEQNRFLLVDEEGQPTDRGQQILQHTPAGRFGEPQDLVGTIQWLLSPGAEFVTGVMVPVDGGFSAYSGV
jgi:NAD(P)-dependent dehydrogenase (short-subunit alcohol dehydrogenase family)